MLHSIVAVYDKKTEAYLKPIFVPTEATAVRSFQDVVNSPDTEFNRHPEDYSMHVIGEWNDHNAEFLLPKQPKLLIEASALITIAQSS